MLHRFQAWLGTPGEGVRLSPEDQDIFPMTGYCALLGVAAHSLNIPMFAIVGQSGLAALNIASAFCFVVVIALWRRGMQRTAWFLIIFEILLHAMYCCMVFGWSSGFHYPVTLLVPILFLATSFSGMTQVVMCVVIVGSYVALSYVCPPLSPRADPGLNTRFLYYNMALLFLGSAGIAGYYGAAVRSSRKAVAQEFARAEGLLLNVLPAPIASRLKAGETPIADDFSECTVLFADIVGFTPLSAKLEARELVGVLNRLFTEFDHLSESLGVEKIKTIGDNYMAAVGIPDPREDHALVMAEMALGMRRVIAETGEVHGESINVRIGMHSGPAVAGVIGERKFIYDLWGDTVNVAARMESHGVSGEIQLSQASHELIKDTFETEDRGDIEVKGKGRMRVYLLKGPRA